MCTYLFQNKVARRKSAGTKNKKIFSICVFVSQANNGGRTPVSEGAPPVALTAVPFFFALGACVYSILATLE